MNPQPLNQCPHTNSILKDWNLSSDFLVSEEGILYNKNWKALSYDSNYFLEEYKKVYHKTYLEDEENIRKLAKKRISLLKKYITSKHQSLLEIGCAMGFFLDEIKNEIPHVEGIEVSEFAVSYARDTLLLNVHKRDLLDFIKNNKKKYDIIASFYVIEHFREQKEIFEFISHSLKKDGLWIGSLPSIHGPLFDYHLEQWIESHPVDHFVDYSPKALKKIFKLYDLEILLILPANYHQERTKGFLRMIPPSLYKFYCNFFSYGDTIEFIVIKRN